MKNLTVITRVVEEMNPAANPEKSNNGGGYSWPHITLELSNGNVVHIADNSCGEFGVDVTVIVHDAEDKEVAAAAYGELALYRHGYSTFDKDTHVDLLSVIELEGYHVPTAQSYAEREAEEEQYWDLDWE